MPHISKQEIDPKELEQLFEEFSGLLEKAVKKNKLDAVLLDFMTDTERVMFAKRFAVIVMLQKNVPIYTIAQKLGMSPATVDRMSLRYEMGKYASFARMAQSLTLSEKVELFLLTTGGLMPPIMGHKRVKELKKKL